MNWLRRLMRAESAAVAPAEADAPDAWLRTAFECECRGDAAGADQGYRRVLEREPEHTDALYFLGRMALRDRRVEEAIALLQQAVERRPGEVLYRLELGAALLDARRFEEAAALFERCVELQPECTRLRNNYAVALIEMNRREKALPELERLRMQLPNVSEVHFNLAGIYREYGRTDEAIAAYRRALELTPDHAPTYSNLLLELNYSASLDAPAIFAEHQRFGERFARRYEAPAPDPAWPRRLRIGYLSPDFRNHVVMRFMEPILARHDRARFEVWCYATNARKDAVTARLRALVEHWVDAEELGDAALADRIRADRIDVLIDLAGHTAGNSATTLAMKPAPIQATYLGYPNTIGLGAVDVRITDGYADPPGEADRLSAERLVRLPRTYFCYRPEPESPAPVPLPALQKGEVTFGCFNNFAKLSAPFLDAAARVLAEVPDSRLLLKARPLSIASLAQSVRERFTRAGIAPGRLELRGWEEGVTNHLSIYNSVDIALDSFPYNGATTTCESLWMGVPVVTLLCDRHAGRAGSSLLHGVGLGELVARTVDEYVAICKTLAADLPRLAKLRGGLRERMRGSALMDEAGLARALEASYLELWEKRAAPAAPPAGEGTESGTLAGARRLQAAGRRSEARALCEKILIAAPARLEALTLLWDLAFEEGAPGAAVDWINRAIGADRGEPAFHYMLGCALQALGRLDDAIAAFRAALALDPGHAKAHNNLGVALEAAGDLDGAAECYRAAVGRDPAMAQALYNLGNLHAQLGQAEQAIGEVGAALAIEPDHADWRCNLGSLRRGVRQLDEALAEFRAAIAIDAGFVRAWGELGDALLAVGRVGEARAAYDEALKLDPDNADMGSRRLVAQQLGTGDAPKALLERHLAWRDRHARHAPRATAHRRLELAEGARLNVGYVAPCFVRNALASHLVPVLAAHDRSRFRVFCYSALGPEPEESRRALGECDWRSIAGFPNELAADLVRADGIDILVDLAGHAGGRPLLFARRPAPVQASWLGYPGTTGLDTVDFRLTDAIADPQGRTERWHSERLLRLAAGAFCYRPAAELGEISPPPHVRAGHVTFGCLADLCALTPAVTALWARILLALPQARLLISAPGLAAASAQRALREQLLGQGIPEARSELRSPEADDFRNLAACRDIDIALDPWPWSATTAICDLLWMGVPLVSLTGDAYASRTGASILARAGLAELAADTPEAYLERALSLARQTEKLRALRAGMRERLRTSSLLDVQGFTSALEAAYRRMWGERPRAPA
ncbi:MAG TPA: tetratricopeptide repeat protein [Burkholderiales bacterium]|nr:tetratricopeptide repeat protein [Burkholderiales bacterium]